MKSTIRTFFDRTTLLFLKLVSGGEVIAMLNDILHPSQRDQVPAVGGVTDVSGRKRLDRLSNIIQKSPPLKPWPLRENTDSKVHEKYFLNIFKVINNIQPSTRSD